MNKQPKILVVDHDSAALFDDAAAAGVFIMKGLQMLIDCGELPQLRVIAVPADEAAKYFKNKQPQPLTDINRFFIPGGAERKPGNVKRNSPKVKRQAIKLELPALHARSRFRRRIAITTRTTATAVPAR